MREQYGLSPREYEVLLLVALGLTNADVARTLFVAEKTAKAQLSTAMRKLGVKNRVQAAYLTWESCRPQLRSMLESVPA